MKKERRYGTRWQPLVKILPIAPKATGGRLFLPSVLIIRRIIISEIGLPLEAKQIKPVQNIDGIAGGEKFLVNSILFKFAIDNKGIYGGNEAATRKMAGQDLLW
jgi:hypothetical protein